MGQVAVAGPGNPELLDSLEDVFRFRHKVFYERLGWEVGSDRGMEHDSFDDLEPVHMFYRNDQGRVEGYWRLMPTSGPYMLQDVFPVLLRGETAPRHPSVWEISRFAVIPEERGDRHQASLCAITFDMLREGVDFALKSGIRHYVFVTSVAVERLLRRAGLTLHRFGDGKAQRIGKVLSVACWIDINEDTCRAVYKVPKAAVGMEAA